MNDRFWSKVENSSGADCWQWMGYTSGNGYGHFGIKRNGKHITVGAHCVAWELRRGPIPKGLHELHHCDNPGCVNPNHLFVDTRDGNMEDMVCKGRSARGEKNGNSKLTWNDIPYVQLFSAAGAYRRSVANRYGVTRQAIGFILAGRTWRESESERCAIQEFWSGMFSEVVNARFTGSSASL